MHIYIYILNRKKNYYKIDKEILRDNARDKYKNSSQEEKKRKNMEEIDVIKCLKKKTKN